MLEQLFKPCRYWTLQWRAAAGGDLSERTPVSRRCGCGRNGKCRVMALHVGESSAAVAGGVLISKLRKRGTCKNRRGQKWNGWYLHMSGWKQSSRMDSEAEYCPGRRLSKHGNRFLVTFVLFPSPEAFKKRIDKCTLLTGSAEEFQPSSWCWEINLMISSAPFKTWFVSCYLRTDWVATLCFSCQPENLCVRVL